MATNAKRSRNPTDYESRQIEGISAWKSKSPNLLSQLISRLAQPVTQVVEFIIPDRIAMTALEAAYKAAALSATEADIKQMAGVDDISALHHTPLEICDGLSRRVGAFAQGLATVEGAVTGAGGVWTTILDIPLLFGLCLRTIIKIGHCYGYSLNRPTDRAWVLGVFAVALTSTRQKRAVLMARLWEIEDLLLEETQEQVVVQEATTLVTQIEVFEDIPVFGAATGALLNLLAVHKTEVAARRLFQERWLHDNSKVDRIAPAADNGKLTTHRGWSDTLAWTCYTTIYNASFSVAFPVSLAAEVFASIAHPATTRLRQGKGTTVNGRASRFFGGRRGRLPFKRSPSNGTLELATS